MFKNLLAFFIFFFISPYLLLSNQLDYSLHKGDSLFNGKKYIQAFDEYAAVSDSAQQFTSRMLLKMAYIKEGLGDYTSALFYLNKYYTHNPERVVLRKMEDLAYQYKLNGYNYTDLEYFISIYNNYYYYIISVFLLASAFILISISVRKRNKRPLGKIPLLFILLLGASYVINNYKIIPTKAIVFNSGSLLMSAPSAGSELLYVADKGHRAPALGSYDIWTKIEWEDKEVYIRTSDIKLVDDAPRSIWPGANLFP